MSGQYCLDANIFVTAWYKSYPRHIFSSLWEQISRGYLNEWIKALNGHGGFGKWRSDVSFHPSDLEQILKKYLRQKI